jgi:hypothetical protein
MTSMSLRVLLIAGATLAVGACNKPAATVTNTTTAETNTSTSSTASSASKDPISSAESAAPASLAHDAAVVTADSSGAMKQLRAGKNGWTCMPDAPDTPGPDPMCFDANAGKWADAWIHHKTPPDGTPGVMYMLEGGTDASNTDPYAKQPTAENDWIKTGPHIMLVGSKAMLAGYPSGAKPDTSTPFVMWAGTPYAHLMVPVNKG